MRWYKLFGTKKERKQWENEMKKKGIGFKVCFRERLPMFAENNHIYITEEGMKKYKYAVVYMTNYS